MYVINVLSTCCESAFVTIFSSSTLYCTLRNEIDNTNIRIISTFRSYVTLYIKIIQYDLISLFPALQRSASSLTGCNCLSDLLTPVIWATRYPLVRLVASLFVFCCYPCTTMDRPHQAFAYDPYDRSTHVAVTQTRVSLSHDH